MFLCSFVAFQRAFNDVACFKQMATLTLQLFGLSPSLRCRLIMNGYLLAMYSANTDFK